MRSNYAVSAYKKYPQHFKNIDLPELLDETLRKKSLSRPKYVEPVNLIIVEPESKKKQKQKKK